MTISASSRSRRHGAMFRSWLLFGAAILPACAAHAQASNAAPATAANEGGQVEEILVTAQRRQESSQKIPISITAFSANQLQNFNLTSTADLQFATPGLIAQAAGGNSLIFLRGVGSPIANLGADSSVATYVDGFYIGSPQGTVQELYDAERVEILKGPQASLYGRNANGGAINFVSRRPDLAGFHARVSAAYGTEDEREVGAYLTGPLSDTVAFSIAGLYRERDTYLRIADPAPPGINPTEMNVAVRGKLLWEPSDNYNAVLSASYTRRRGIEAASFLLIPGSASEAAALGAPVSDATRDLYLSGDAPRQDVRQHMLFLTQELRVVDEITIRSLTGYVDTKQIRSNFPVSASTAQILSFGAKKGESEQISQELQILSDADKPFSWIAGASYFHAKDGFDDQFTRLPLASALLGLYSNQSIFVDQKTDALAGYVEGTYRFTDKLSIIAGGRYTRETKKLPVSNYQVVSGIPTPSPLYDCAFAGLTFGVNCGGAALGLPPIPPAFVGAGAAALNSVRQPYAPAKETWGRFSYRGTLRYEFTPSASVYYTYSRGFKSGVFSLSGLNATANVPVEPETLISNEVGLKSELFDRRARFNAAAFHYKLKNTQAQVLLGGTSGTSVLSNAGTAILKGAEAELTLAPVDGLQLSASGAYVDSEYKDFVSYPSSVPAVPGGGTTGVGGNRTVAASVVGNPLVFAPKFTSTLSANYVYKPAGGGALSFTALWAYNDGYCLEQTCRGRQASFSAVDASVSFTLPDERTTFTIFGKNLTNDRFLTNYLQLPTGDVAIYSRPISAGARIEYKF